MVGVRGFKEKVELVNVAFEQRGQIKAILEICLSGLLSVDDVIVGQQDLNQVRVAHLIHRLQNNEKGKQLVLVFGDLVDGLFAQNLQVKRNHVRPQIRNKLVFVLSIDNHQGDFVGHQVLGV